MAGEVLYGADVGVRVEQLADERAPRVVRAEAWHAGTVDEEVEAQQHRLRVMARPQDMAALGHRRKQRAGPGAAADEPVVDRLSPLRPGSTRCAPCACR